MNIFATAFIASTLSVFSMHAYAERATHPNLRSFDAPYQLGTVTGLSLSKRFLLGGSVISAAQVNLSAQMSGDVLRVMGREGDKFRKGEYLVVLERGAIQAQKNSVYAEIASANEALRNAGVQYSKSIVSPNSGGFGGIPNMFSMFTDPMLKISGQGNPDFDKFAHRTSRYTAYQQSKNRLKQAQSKLRQIEERLKDSRIVAPFDGVIVAKFVNQGDIVQQGQTLIKFSDVNKLQVEVNVPSRLIKSLKLNKRYRVKLDIANVVVNAVLSQIYPVANDNRHSVKVKFDLPDNTKTIPGGYAEIEIFETDSKVLTPVVLNSAIMWRSSLPSVFVVNPRTKKTELRFIRLGEKEVNNQRSVLSGLSIGDKVVTNPNVLMVSGMDI